MQGLIADNGQNYIADEFGNLTINGENASDIPAESIRVYAIKDID